MDYRDLISQRENEWRPLFRRMDEDRALLQLDPFVLRDKDDNPVPDVLHTTLNDPAMFGAWVVAELLATKEDWRVTGDKLNEDETSIVERWIKASFAKANRRLRRAGMVDLEPFAFEQMCFRGRGAARCLTLDDGTLDILPCDTRYLVYDTDYDGLNWIAPWYYRTKPMIEREYPDFLWEGRDDTQVKVQDLWFKDGGRVYNQVYIGERSGVPGNPYYDEPQQTDLDYIPFVVETVPVGSFFQDDGNIQRWGESVFYLARNEIALLNEIISIMRSIHFKTYKGAYTWDNKGELPNSPKPGDVVGIEEGTKGYNLVQMQDLQQASVRLLSVIDQRLQAGTRSRIEEGTLQFTLSAVGIRDLKAERDKLYLPRLSATARLKLGLQEMFTKQAKRLGKDIETDGEVFQMSDLDKDYQVVLEYNTTTPRDDVANWALANAIGNSLSLRTKLKEVVKVENVDKEMRFLHEEATHAAEPAIWYYDQAHEYVDLGDETGDGRYYLKALAMAKRGVSIWQKQLAEGIAPDTSVPEGSKTAGSILPPLLGGAGGQGNTQRNR